MNGTLPNSPFATRFSGREGETHLRVTNIAKGQHRRPAFIILALVLLVILSCGWFFSFGAKARGLTVVMETQYYDDLGNYIEIPAAAPAGGGEAPGAAALNQALDDLRTQYRLVLSGTLSGPAGLENCCLFYLTQTDRYYNFLFYRDEFRTDLSCGHVTALVYDRRKDALVTLADALTLAGQTEDGLCQALADQYDPQLKQENPAADLCIQNQQVEGFRIGADGKVLFYLTARIDDRDDSVQDAVSGGDYLYIWSSGTFAQYDEEQPLVPEEECAAFDPPLYWQWRQEGRPQVGFTPVDWSDQARQLLRMTAEGFDLLYNYEITVPLRITQGPHTLLMARMQGAPHTAGLDDLAIGVWDSDSGSFVGDTYFLPGDDARFTTWTEDGADYLLCANTAMWQGYEDGSALRFLRFENGRLQPICDLPAAVQTCSAVDWTTEEARAMLQPLDPDNAADRFWQDRKAIPVGDGFDLYERDPDWDVLRQAEHAQWLYVGHIPLTDGSGQQLLEQPFGQSIVLSHDTGEMILNWLRQHNSSGGSWYLLDSIPLNPAAGDRHIGNVVYEGSVLHLNQDSSRLNNSGDWQSTIALRLRLDVSRLEADGSWQTVPSLYLLLSQDMTQVLGTADSADYLTEEERTLIRDYYAASYDPVYLPGEAGTWTSDQYGLRLTDIQYMGATALYETEGIVFRVVEQTQPDGQPDSEHPCYIVLQRDAAGSYYGVLGECPAYALHSGRAALTPEQAALQVCYKLDDLEVSLWRDGYPGGVGPGASLDFSCLDTGHIETTQRPDLEPVYQTGDYWYQADGQLPTGSFTALCYHSAGDNTGTIRSLRSDMTALATYRGVRVGDSREQVQDLYPEAHSGDFWGLYPDEDYLWYSAWDGDPAYGPAILFFFDGQDKVERFELINMVD